ncbi:hypothetical protein JCM18899A_08680 [Nocardioides sp. AN3]
MNARSYDSKEYTVPQFRAALLTTDGNAPMEDRSEDAAVKPARTDLLLARIDLEGCRNPESFEPPHGTRGRLLLAAVDMFSTRGFDACSMRALAQSIGIGPGAIYNHYSSKGDLLVAAVDYVLSDFMRSVLEGLTLEPPAKNLGIMLRRHVTYRATNRRIAKANDRLLDRDFLVRTMSRQDRARITGALREYTHIARELIELTAGDDADVDPVLRTFSVLNVVNESANWYQPGGTLNAQALAEQFQILIERLLDLKPGTLE